MQAEDEFICGWNTLVKGINYEGWPVGGYRTPLSWATHMQEIADWLLHDPRIPSHNHPFYEGVIACAKQYRETRVIPKRKEERPPSCSPYDPQTE